MRLQFADFAHATEPFVDLRELALEALDLGEGESGRYFIVVDDVNDGRLALRYQKLAAFQHCVHFMEHIAEEGVLGSLNLIPIEVTLTERLRPDQYLSEACNARAQHSREPMQVLIDLVGMLLRTIRRQFRLGLCQIVREDACVTNELAAVVNDHRERTQWVLLKIVWLLMLALKDVNLFKLVLEA